MKKSVGIALMTSLLAACGGGGSSSVPAVQTQSGPAKLALTLHVPGANNAQALRLKHPLYTSRDTQGLGFEYKSYVSTGDTPYSGAPSSTPSFGSAITAGSNGCGSAAADGSFTCTIYVPNIAAGYYDFRVTLWSAAPAGCSALGAGCSFSGNELSTVALQNYAVKTGQSTTYSFTLLPVVDNVSIALNGGIVDGTASSVTGTLVAKDAMGDIILGSDHFVDASGNQISIAPVITNNVSGSLSFSGTPSFTSGGAGNTFTLNYDGTQQFPSSGSSQPAVSASVSGGNVFASAQTPATSVGVTQTGGSLNVGAAPQIALAYNLAGIAPESVMADAQDDVLVSNGSGAAGSGIICAAGPCAAGAGSHGAGANIDFITLGTDNDVWAVSNTQNNLLAYQPANLSTLDNLFTETTPFTAGGFVFGQDNQIYVSKPANPGGIYYFDTSGTQHGPITSNIAAAGGISKMIVGPTVDGTGDDSVCFIEPATKQLGCLDIATLGATPPSVIVTTLAKTPSSLTLGPNGYIYVGETGEIQAYDLSSGSLSQATNSPFNLTNSAYNVTGITAGSDGNVWFVENHALVGRLAIQSSVVKTIDEWSSSVTGLASNATPNGIVALHSASTLYLTDSANNEVWSITP